MLVRLRKTNGENNTSSIFKFPYDEEDIKRVYTELKVEISNKPNCSIVEILYEKDMDEILKGIECSIEEINFFFKKLDSFDTKEKQQFYASAYVEKPNTMAELINLSFNIHCYSVINDFNDINKLGKILYLYEKQTVAAKELDEFDGESFVKGLIESNIDFKITPYGVLYKNRNEPEQVYNGKQFPLYNWEETIAILQLTAKGENEFIYLPCADDEVKKAILRLEVSSLSDCDISVLRCEISDKITDILYRDAPLPLNIDTINDLAKRYKEMGSHDIGYLEKLIDYIKPKNMEEIFALMDSMYEFELFDHIKDPESYGRYIICESGHFEYDSNLEGYIDFKRYGQEKIAQEVGAFSKNGYITYHGYNQKLSNLLFESLGMVITEPKGLQTLKLYMPLTVVTYEGESEDGCREYLNEPEEISNEEAVRYIDEILSAIKEYSLTGEEKRGMMKYYEEYDSVSAKVLKYVFSVELVEEELMGVAVLTLNDTLNQKELEKIKDIITGQASDGYVLKNNMGPSSMEMV
jgi:uncharacterized protein YnzC (UPF0291/DUF896 family)